MIKIVLVTLLVISTIFNVQSAAIEAQEPKKEVTQDAPVIPDATPTKLPDSIGMTSESAMIDGDIPVAISSAALASLGGK